MYSHCSALPGFAQAPCKGLQVLMQLCPMPAALKTVRVLLSACVLCSASFNPHVHSIMDLF